MNELALFAGVGGGLLGTALLGWNPICAVEIEPYCREVLLRRQRDGMLPVFPIWDDIRTFDGKPWRDFVDVVTAGFPCQPFSQAGRQKAGDDARNLWPETIRIVREVTPPQVFLENVPGLLTKRHNYFETILWDLAQAGYDARWTVVRASDIGAKHRRARLWILANYRGIGSRQRGARRLALSSSGATQQALPLVANPNAGGRKGQEDKVRSGGTSLDSSNSSWWATEPSVGRVAYGVANRVDRLKALGNGQVSGVVREAWNQLVDMA